MKRLFLTFLIVLTLALLSLVFIIRLPAVQTHLVRNALENAGVDAQLEKISIGFSQANLQALTILSADQSSIHIEDANIQYSLGDILGGFYNLQSVTISGLSITLPQPTEQTAQEGQPQKDTQASDKAKSSFEGIFNQLYQANTRWQLGSLEASGVVIRPDQGSMNFMANSAGFSADMTGRIDYELKYQSHSESTQGLPDHIHGALEVTLDQQSRPRALKLEGQIENAGNRYAFLASAIARDTLDAEDYSIELNYIPEGGIKQILGYMDGGFTYADKRFGGKYKIVVDDTIINGMSLFDPVKNFNLSAYGDVEKIIGTDAATLRGGLRFNIVKPEAWNPSLAEAGSMGIHARYAFTATQNAIELNDLTARMNSLNIPSILELDLASPFTFPLNAQFEDYTLPKGKLITVRLNTPLSLLTTLSDLPLQAQGSLSVAMDLSTNEVGKFTLSTHEPMHLKIAEASTDDGAALLKDYTILASPHITYTTDRIDFALKEVQIQSFQKKAGVAQIEGSLLPHQGTYRMHEVAVKQTLYLNALFEQPFLEKHRHFLPQEPLALDFDYALLQEHDQLLVKHLESHALDASGKKLLTTRTRKPLQIPTDQTRFKIENYQGELVEVTANAFALKTLHPFLPNIQTQGTLEGTFVVSIHDAQPQLKTEKPINISALSIQQNGKTLLDNLDISGDLNIQQELEKISVTTQNLSISSAQKNLIQGHLGVVYSLLHKTVVMANYDLTADLKQLQKQPILSDHLNARTGIVTIEGTTDRNPTAHKTLKTKTALTVSDLTFKHNDQRISKLESTLALEGTLEPLSLKGSIPVQMTSTGGTTDATLTITPASPKQPQNISLTGKSLVASDLTLLAEIIRQEDPKTPSTSKPAASTPSTPSQAPFWGSFNGQAKIDLNKLVYNQNLLTDVSAEIEATPQKLDVRSLRANMHSTPLEINGLFTFDPTRQRFYDFSGKLNAQKVSLGDTFDIKKYIDGLFTIQADLRSTGNTLDEVVDRIQGDFTMQSQQGNLYLLKNSSSLLGKLSDLTSATGGLLQGVLGTISGEGSQLAKQTSIISDVSNVMRTLSFYKFDASITRDENLDLIFKNIEINGELMSLRGQGIAKHSQEGMSLLEQPLSASLQVGAKGALASGLGQLGLLTQQKDRGEGFYNAYTFDVSGTLGSPNFSELGNPLLSLINKLNIFKPRGERIQSAERPSENTRKEPSEELIKGVADELLKGLF